MKFNNAFTEKPTRCYQPAIPLGLTESYDLVSEQPLTIELEGKPLFDLVYTPDHPEELVLGRLLSEGVIQRLEDIDELSIDDEGRLARVFLCEGRKTKVLPPEGRLAKVFPPEGRLATEFLRQEPPIGGISPGYSSLGLDAEDREWLLRLAEAAKQDNWLYDRTHGVHGCRLGRIRGEVLCLREDLGRHNALDKVLGYGLMHQLPLRECFVYTTGRMPVDMVTKLVTAGIPLLISKTYPTAEAVALARQAGIRLITVKDAIPLIWS